MTVATTEPSQLSYREAITAALEDEMVADPSVVLIGEDVDADGGVFKTNIGLVEQFGERRVRNTPICENTFVGAALGMSLIGLRPVVEIMFSDFLPTAADALINQLPKYRFMSGGQFTVPVTIRAIGGGTGGFGAQHSATGESWLIGVPGLRIVAASSPALAYGLLRSAIRDDNPVLLFEHKALYGAKGMVQRGSLVPLGTAHVVRSGRDLTIVATMLMVRRAMEAAEALDRTGISVEVIDLCSIRPLDTPAIAASVGRTGRLLVVEEQVHAGGWGATLISELSSASCRFEVPPRAVSLPADMPIPYSPDLEAAVIPSVDRIVAAARELRHPDGGGSTQHEPDPR